MILDSRRVHLIVHLLLSTVTKGVNNRRVAPFPLYVFLRLGRLPEALRNECRSIYRIRMNFCSGNFVNF